MFSKSSVGVFIATIVLLLVTTITHAQNNSVDSLTKVFNSSNDTTKVILIIKIAQLLTVNSPQEAEILCDSAVRFSKKIKFDNGLAQAYYTSASTQNTIGKYDLAIKNVNLAIVLFNKLNKNTGLLRCYILMGNTYLGLKKHQKALDNYKAAFDIAIQQPDKNANMLATASTGIANVYAEIKDFDSALPYFEEAEKMFTKCGNELGASYIKNMMAECLYKTGQLQKAEKNVLMAIPTFQKHDDEYALGAAYFNLGFIYYLQNNLTTSTEAFKTSLNYRLKRKAWDNIQESALELSTVYAKSHNYEQALLSYKIHSQYKDSVLNKERNKAIEEAEVKFETVKKEHELTLQKAELESSKQIINRRNYLIYGIIIFLILITVFLIFALQQNKQKRKANALLIEKNAIINIEKKRSDDLLLNILPADIADELKLNGEAEAKLHNEVSILFTDFKGFTQLSETVTAKELIAELNYCFIAFDNIIHKYGIEKIKTIGDSYMAASGLPVANNMHAHNMVNAALEIRDFMNVYKNERISQNKKYFELRIGIHTGEVVAGIVGIKKFAYDVWGDTVNTASRMESSGEVGKVNISETTYNKILNNFSCEPRGLIEAKGKGTMRMFFVEYSTRT